MRQTVSVTQTPTNTAQFAFRILIGMTGCILALYGHRKRDFGGKLLILLGLGALVRAFSNIETPQLFQLVLHPQTLIKKRIDIDAPIDLVFDFWKNFANFSKFMSYVQDVRVNEKQGFTWTVSGPAGVPIHWDTHLTALIPNQMIAWQSLPGSLIKNSGQIIFKGDNSGAKTSLYIQLSFAPPAGVLGHESIHLLGKILGFDPSAQVDNDLRKMKTLIESDHHWGARNLINTSA